MIISWYLQKNGEDDLVDDIDYVATDVPDKDITDNDIVGSNENDDGYDVGVYDDDEDEEEDDATTIDIVDVFWFLHATRHILLFL